MTKIVAKPIFARALGKSWEKLAPAVRRHYDLHPNAHEEVSLEGVMSVHYPRLAVLLLGFVRLFDGLVLLRQKNIQVRVRNSTSLDRSAMFWHRTFELPGKKKPVIFRSKMEYAGGNEIIEYVGAYSPVNIGIRMNVFEKNTKLLFESTGYVLKIGRVQLPIPGQLLLGKAAIAEEALGENSISMGFTIEHPLFGRIYSYSGQFTL